jgi:cytochrome c556
MPKSHSLSKPAILATAAVMLLGSLTAFADDALPAVDPAIAATTADQKVEARQKAMKEDGGILRQAARATGDDAAKIATTVLQNFVNFPALFADGATNARSEADPKIWQEFDKFTDIFKAGQEDASKMIAAAKAGDQTAYQDAFKSLGQKCFQCHQTYRVD